MRGPIFIRRSISSAGFNLEGNKNALPELWGGPLVAVRTNLPVQTGGPLAQTMGNSGGAGGIGGIAAHLLGTYAMMQGINQQPYSTDPTSANFMGPPATLAGYSTNRLRE